MDPQTKSVAADDWIAHDGGRCPVDPTTKVFVRFEDGCEPEVPYSAGWWDQFWMPGLDSARRPRNRIVAYRLVPTVVNLAARLDRIAEARRAAA